MDKLRKKYIIQSLSALLHNIHLPNFLKGKIYQGPGKKLCLPGLNCYSCPGAAGSCPIGSLQAVIGSQKYRVSFYVLGQKEQHGRSCRRAIRAILKPRHADRFLSVVSLVDRSFTNYVTGQMTEAVILGCLCCVGMLIFRFPYAPVISVVVGFTALIPIFGAWVGGAVGAFLIVFVSPMKALWFLVFLVVLQQLENNLVYPRVVGKSIGLPAIWVLAGITVGGSLGGVLGMVCAVPVTSTLYELLQANMDYREKIRNQRPSPQTED